MSLHGSASHFELARDFSVVTALQKQLDDLLFARSQPNGLLRHRNPLRFRFALQTVLNWDVSNRVASTMPLCDRDCCDQRTPISTGTCKPRKRVFRSGIRPTELH